MRPVSFTKYASLAKCNRKSKIESGGRAPRYSSDRSQSCVCARVVRSGYAMILVTSSAGLLQIRDAVLRSISTLSLSRSPPPLLSLALFHVCALSNEHVFKGTRVCAAREQTFADSLVGNDTHTHTLRWKIAILFVLFFPPYFSGTKSAAGNKGRTEKMLSEHYKRGSNYDRSLPGIAFVARNGRREGRGSNREAPKLPCNSPQYGKA